MQLYQPSAEQIQQFTRTARKVERMMKKQGGSPVDPAFALLKLEEVIASTLTFREMEKFTIAIPALAQPTLAEIQAKYPGIRSIERDTSPTGAVVMNLATVLRTNEKDAITGAEYEKRIAPRLALCLGYQQAMWIVDHQNELPAEFMALLGKVYIDFSGLVVVNGYGDRIVFCLDDVGKRWYLCWSRLSSSVCVSGRVAVSGK